ncbi:hypothetical protein ACFYY1_39035 [Streptomyces sp. NPDC001890]|uniref:hypothetical protein n=1 Tax=Streptomyces sp. NPDC001890 TaxID=3364620 RepID=UPI00367798C8
MNTPLTSPPDMYPGCTWTDHPVSAPTDPPGHIGMAATVEERTGLTTRYTVHAYDPYTGTVTVRPEMKEDRAGVARPFPADERSRNRDVDLDDLDELRLIHYRERDDHTGLHIPTCRHEIKAAFTAGGDRGVPGPRRVYRFWMQTNSGATYRFLVRAPSQPKAHALALTWWQGTPAPQGWTGGHLDDGEVVELLTCDGARDMRNWPHLDSIADPL